jgi:glycosyltransferase involved in cell wall biosynthesis
VDTKAIIMVQRSEVALLDKEAMPKPRIMALVPAYNEERFIASVILATKPYVGEVVVVDDGSTDRTAQLAQAAGATVIRQPRNLGKAEALNAGFRYARSLGPDVVVCLDGDAQHDPVDIPEVIGPILESQADVVIGSRFLDKKSEIPGWRIVGQHTLTLVTNVTSGIKTTDSQSGFRAFSPMAFEALRFHTGGLGVESEMQFKIGQAGLRVAEVPIHVSYRDGNKRNPVVQGIQILDAIVTLVARRRPLLFFSFPGSLLVLAGLFLGVRVYLTMSTTGLLPTGTAILTAICILGGLLLAITGIMLNSLSMFAEHLKEEVKQTVLEQLEKR